MTSEDKYRDDVILLDTDKNDDKNDKPLKHKPTEPVFKVEYLYIVLNLVSAIGIVVANKWVLLIIESRCFPLKNSILEPY